MKSLVREMVTNFSERFQSYGICVRELSGDQQLNQEQISETQVFCYIQIKQNNYILLNFDFIYFDCLCHNDEKN